MKGDLVLLDGKPARPGEAGDIDALLSVDFVYQRIHALDHRPLNCDAHIELAERDYSALYGEQTGLTRKILEEEVHLLLECNRYPKGSHLVTLYLLPPEEAGGAPGRLLSCRRQMLYRGYTLWHTAIRTITLPCSRPFAGHKTAASLVTHTYGKAFARRKGADAAITETPEGVLTGVGEDPLFAVRGRSVITTPLERGAGDSVERRLGLEASRAAGFAMLEQSVEKDMLREYDELFSVTSQGVVGIRSCDGRLYPTSAARVVAETMAGMAR